MTPRAPRVRMETSITGPHYAFNTGDVLELARVATDWPDDIRRWLRNGTARPYKGRPSHVTVVDPVTFGQDRGPSPLLSRHDVLERFDWTDADLQAAQQTLNFPAARITRSQPPPPHRVGLLTDRLTVSQYAPEFLWTRSDVDAWQRVFVTLAHKVTV